MKKSTLLTFCWLVIGCLSGCCGREAAAEGFVLGTYTVESLIGEAELASPDYGKFRFIYFMAVPQDWMKQDFGMPQESIDRMADRFDYARAGGNMPLVPRLIAQAHACGCSVLLSLGGQQEFVPFLEHPERLAGLARYLVRLVERNDYDGVDIDWEYTIDPKLHAGLMESLRAGLDELSRRNGRTYYVTTALSFDRTYDRPLAERLSAAVDWINLMTYDLGEGIWGLTPSHNTPMGRIRAGLAERWSVFDKRKLCLGLANYGFRYEGLKPGETSELALYHHGSYITYRDFRGWEQRGWTQEYDPAEEVSYYFSPDRSQFVTMDSPESIMAKVRWIVQNGYRGVFWWEYHHDYERPDATYPAGRHYLIDLVDDYLKTECNQ